jgi:hypothetical protein
MAQSGMGSGMTLIERAYDLARTGRYTGVAQIRKQLESEGYFHVERHLDGPTIKQALRRLCDTARKEERAEERRPEAPAA